jgi:hypothetical protein
MGCVYIAMQLLLVVRSTNNTITTIAADWHSCWQLPPPLCTPASATDTPCHFVLPLALCTAPCTLCHFVMPCAPFVPCTFILTAGWCSSWQLPAPSTRLRSQHRRRDCNIGRGSSGSSSSRNSRRRWRCSSSRRCRGGCCCWWWRVCKGSGVSVLQPIW